MKTKATIIPAGYRITVDSWENDGDNSRTETIEGLSEQDAKFTVDFALLFGSVNGKDEGFGNLYEPSDQEIEGLNKAIKRVVAKHSPLSSDLHEVFEDVDSDIDVYLEYAYDLGLTGGDFFTRVLESIKVEYIPEPIEIQDVTAKFVPKSFRA